MRSATHVESRRKVVWGGRVLLGALIAAVVLSTSCGTVREGTGSSFLVLTSLTGPSGASTVLSDVISDTGSTFNDSGTAGFQVAMKDPTLSPTVNNAITIDRYHVTFIRSDGHNIQGVDVPFAFDGAVTLTVQSSGSVGFTLVRHVAKEEAPLKTLSSGGSPITTIAQVTFYGQDQSGHDVSVSGNIEVTFSNFGG